MKKLLVLMKRFGANKDMVLGNFGRQVRLFEALKRYGYRIDFLCADYTKREKKEVEAGGIRYFIRPWHLFRPFYFVQEAKRLIKKEQYDVIIGTSDPVLGILGSRLAAKSGKKFVYDLQDHYATYDSYRLPLVARADRKAVKDADLLLAVSETLCKEVSPSRAKPTLVIENGIDMQLFRKIGRKEARRKLDLPRKGKIIAYVGEISRTKGADVMLDAFQQVLKELPDTHLLLSGKVFDNISLKQKNLIFRELPERKEVVAALNAADVALIPNNDNLFSRYCFPYKALEYMACGLPIVATAVGDMKHLLKDYPDSLCEPGNATDMAEKIIAQLKKGKRISYAPIIRQLSWDRLAGKLHKALQQMG